MKGIGLWIYTALWSLGGALIGVVVGLLLKNPPVSVSSVLLVVGIGLLFIGYLWGRRAGRRRG